MLNTIMKTAHGLLLNTVFYLMSMCVLTGALGKILTEFGVVDLLQKMLRHVMRPLYNMPGVAVVASIMTFLSDNPAIITLSKNKQFAKYFKVYQYISLANFGTAFGMGLLVIVFMIGQGYFAAPFIGLIGAACGGIIATRLMQYFICKKYPEYRTKDALSAQEIELIEKESKQKADEEEKPNTFIRVLNALLDGGKSGVEIGLAIIPGVIIICTMVMMFTFRGSVEGLDAAGNEIMVYTGEAYQGCGLLPLIASKLNFIFEWLFGFNAPELIAFPITALGAVGAALSLIPEFTAKGIINDNAVAVFTAMGMCWSGFLSTHTAMLDSMGYRKLLVQDFISQIIGGIGAGIIAHWLYATIIYLSTLFQPSPVWNVQTTGWTCISDDPMPIELVALDDSSYVAKNWFGEEGCDLCFKVNKEDSTIIITNAYANQQQEYFFVRINQHAQKGEPSYAVVCPTDQFSEFDGDKQNGHLYTFIFVYDPNRKGINKGYYELTWGNRERQTKEAEEDIQQLMAEERALAEHIADSLLREELIDSILQDINL
jgi:spore maturation protein SpmB